MDSHITGWRTSSYSIDTGQNCVEVADLASGAAVRDSQNRADGHFEIPAAEWRALLGAVRTGGL